MRHQVSAIVTLTTLVVLCGGLSIASHTNGTTGSPPETFVVRARNAAAKYRDVSAAKRDGYRFDNRVGSIEHWRNDDRLVFGQTIDPTRPSGLMYQWHDHKRVLLAAVFLLRTPGQAPPSVPGVFWHHHSICFGPAGIATPLPFAPCPPGTREEPTPEMTHVFLTDEKAGTIGASR